MSGGHTESRISRQGSGAGYPLCEQALSHRSQQCPRPDWVLAIKFYMPVNMGTSADPKADLKRADELVSKSASPSTRTMPGLTALKGWILFDQGRFERGHRGAGTGARLGPAAVGAIRGAGLGLPLPRAI